MLARRDPAPLFQFPPPLDIPDGQRSFSWIAALAVGLGILTFLVWWLMAKQRMSFEEPSRDCSATTPRKPFPAWGWIALIWTIAWWLLSWNRWPWFRPFQSFTYLPLWLGFILAINAFTVRLCGTCMMQRAPGQWLALFGLSAVFWWAFEWLNRFVQNWHYLAVADFNATTYLVYGSLCFSTVLPAVHGIAECLSSSRVWTQRLRFGPSCPWLNTRTIRITLSILAGCSLVLTGMVPRWTYPAIWLAPLVLIALSEPGSNPHSLTGEISRGDWRRAATWMISSLICGLFWELWNWHSLAKWIYTVPGVQRWHLFEMPLLGYAGYLPFGLECLLVADWLQSRVRTRPAT
jgi:hypothetical protein